MIRVSSSGSTWKEESLSPTVSLFCSSLIPDRTGRKKKSLSIPKRITTFRIIRNHKGRPQVIFLKPSLYRDHILVKILFSTGWQFKCSGILSP